MTSPSSETDGQREEKRREGKKRERDAASQLTIGVLTASNK